MISVRVPTVAGTVTAVTSTGFTVKLRDGSSKTVTTSGSTSFLLGDAKSSKSDVSVGARVSVEGTDGTSFAADVVHIVPDLRIGKVTAVTSSSITIQGRNNTTITIHVDASTTYRVKGAAAGKLSDVTVGMYVSAQGLSRADGSLDATSVLAGALRAPKVLPVKPNASTPPS
jgi:preprotein translocase subunit YajC